MSRRPRSRARPATRWTWVDLRLVPVAASVWVGSPGRAVPVPAPARWACCRGAAVAAARRRRGDAAAARPRRAVLLGVLAALAVTAGTGGRARRGPGGLAAAGRSPSPARRSRWSSRLDGDPHRLAGARRAAVHRRRAPSRRSTTGERTHRLDAPVLLFAPADGVGGVSPGEAVTDPRRGVAAARRGRRRRRASPPGGRPLRSARRRVCSGPPASLRDGLAASAARVLDAAAGRPAAGAGRRRHPGHGPAARRRTSGGPG